MVSKIHFSSDKQDWGTPWSLFCPLDDEFNFDLDVCASAANAKVPRFYDEEYDGLAHPWRRTNWCNPPYGRELIKWVTRAWNEKLCGNTTVLLVPSRTDTQWWGVFYDHKHHRMRDRQDEVRFIEGRVKFEGAENSAPFPSAIIVLRGL